MTISTQWKHKIRLDPEAMPTERILFQMKMSFESLRLSIEMLFVSFLSFALSLSIGRSIFHEKRPPGRHRFHQLQEEDAKRKHRKRIIRIAVRQCAIEIKLFNFLESAGSVHIDKIYLLCLLSPMEFEAHTHSTQAHPKEKN